MNERMENQIAPFAASVLRLFRGPLYDDQQREWEQLKVYFNDVKHYLARIGIKVEINENEGFAYLRQPDAEDGEPALPRILRRRALSWEVTLLCVLLRQKLEEFDLKDTDSRKLFVSKGDLKNEIELFFPDRTNRSRLLERLDTYIKNVRDLGYIQQIGKEDPLDPDRTRFEVKRIIRARITNNELEEILTKLEPKDEPTGDDI
jgi:hypothetical protein